MKWYQFDIRDLSDSKYQKWYSLMSEERKERVDLFRFVDDKKRTVAGEMLARRAIAKWCGVSAESIHFGRTEYGKPFAIDLPVEFNISHSGNMVVCAISDTPVGIDAETIRPFSWDVAKRVCCKSELIQLEKCASKSRDFTKMWVMKESFVKMTGAGILRSMNTIDTIQNRMNAVTLERKDKFIGICRKNGTNMLC